MDSARSEHVSAAAHHSRSDSQFMLACACAVAAAMGVPASVIFEGARAPAVKPLHSEMALLAKRGKWRR